MQILVKNIFLLIAATVIAPTVMANDRIIDVTQFNKIYFEGTGTLHIGQGESVSLSVSGEENLLNELFTEVSDGVLHIELENANSAVADLNVYITVANLTEVSSLGKGKILMSGFEVEDLHLRGIGTGEFFLAALQARELSVESRGATRFEISGTADRQVIELGGAGQYLAQHLLTNVGTISIFGAGVGELWVDEWLEVRITGAGSISYRGSPQVALQVYDGLDQL